MVRVDFLVDGFNVYHSLKQASRELQGASTRWLDLRGLLGSYVQLFGRTARLQRVIYFSAFAHHIEAKSPGVVQRHRTYIEALQSTGVEVVLGRFKKGQHYCDTCACHTKRWEEKESDVAIGVRLLEILVRDEADLVVIVSGDTDLVPAIRTARRLFPAKEVRCAFPYGRKNKELEGVANDAFNMKHHNYLNHQLPDPLTLPSGRELRKPAAW